MEIHIDPHTLERAEERGTNEEEIKDPQFNEEVQHLEKWPYSWYSGWIWEKDTGTSVLKRGIE
jgi:hypothetical protein